MTETSSDPYGTPVTGILYGLSGKTVFTFNIPQPERKEPMTDNATYHLMIDVETLGTGPEAAVIQLGACQFHSTTGEVQKSFCINIDLVDSLLNGRKIDEATVAWWGTQDKAVFNDIMSDRVTVREAMTLFMAFLSETYKKGTTPVWCHTTFDFNLVQGYLALGGIELLGFKDARDIRTLIALSGVNLDSYDWSQKTHNALDDCRFQAKYCADALRKVDNAMAALENNEREKNKVVG